MLGSLPSIISSEMLTENTVKFSEISIIDNQVYVVEGRPSDKGRKVLVKISDNCDITTDPYSVTNSVHEYGGDTTCGKDNIIYFTQKKNSQIWKMENGEFTQITKEKNIRYAEPKLTKEYIFAIFEDHSDETNIVNGIVSICRDSHKIISKESNHDFYSGLQISPCEKYLTFFTWNMPNMSWDKSDVWKASIINGNLHDIEKISPNGDISSCDPRFSPDGTIYYISDQSGYWNIYNEKNDAIYSKNADFTKPHWHLGNSLYTFIDKDTIAAIYTEKATDSLALITKNHLKKIPLPFTSYTCIKNIGYTLYFVAASPTSPLNLYSYDLQSEKLTLLRASSQNNLDPSWISTPKEIEFPTRHSETSFAFYYPPINPNHTIDSPPPLLLISHGGPTGHNPPIFQLAIQFWTSRGFAVLDVNYSGSSGFGRKYRNRLYENWGIKDVDDCEDAALFLVEKKLADRNRLVVRGGSAGGYTTLALLTFRDTFCAGASYFGVSDLSLIAEDTHKFESKYLDKLIRPYPEGLSTYQKRSPIYHTDKMKKPILILQGDEDKVVPVNQAEKMYHALLKKNIPTSYLLFRGEGHGFRKKENIIKAIESELYFYQRIFNQETSLKSPPIIIDNV